MNVKKNINIFIGLWISQNLNLSKNVITLNNQNY